MSQGWGPPLALKSLDSGALRAPIYTAIRSPQFKLHKERFRRATQHKIVPEACPNESLHEQYHVIYEDLKSSPRKAVETLTSSTTTTGARGYNAWELET
jgi:hypothetical protein